MPDIYVMNEEIANAVLFSVLAFAALSAFAWFVDYVKKGGRR